MHCSSTRDPAHDPNQTETDKGVGLCYEADKRMELYETDVRIELCEKTDKELCKQTDDGMELCKKTDEGRTVQAD